MISLKMTISMHHQIISKKHGKLMQHKHLNAKKFLHIRKLNAA